MKFIYESHANQPGIYKITNTHSNRIYIGQAKEIKSRWHGHRKSLSSNSHRNKFLLHDFNKCKEELGNDEFLEFHVLEVMENSTKEQRNVREEYWISQHYDKQDSCYNFQQKANSSERSCYSHTSEETSKLISENSKKLWENPEHREKVSEKLSAFWNSDEGKAIASDRAKALWESLEHQSNMSEKMKQRHVYASVEVKEQTKANLEKGRQREAYEKKMAVYREEIASKQVVIREENYVGKKANRVKLFENCNLLSPDGVLYKSIYNLNEFGSVHQIDSWKLQQVIDNIRPSYKGWTKYKAST